MSMDEAERSVIWRQFMAAAIEHVAGAEGHLAETAARAGMLADYALEEYERRFDEFGQFETVVQRQRKGGDR